MFTDMLGALSVTSRKLADAVDIFAASMSSLNEIREEWESEVRPFGCQADVE
jgi:hypothetical protein